MLIYNLVYVLLVKKSTTIYSLSQMAVATTTIHAAPTACVASGLSSTYQDKSTKPK